MPQRRQLRSRRAARQPFAALDHRLGGLLARRGSCALGCGLRVRGRLHDWAAAVGRPTDQLALLASALVRRPSRQVLTHGPRVRSERVQEACRTRLARELRVTRGARGCVCTRRSHRPTARVAAAPRARVAWLARLGRRRADKLQRALGRRPGVLASIKRARPMAHGVLRTRRGEEGLIVEQIQIERLTRVDTECDSLSLARALSLHSVLARPVNQSCSQLTRAMPNRSSVCFILSYAHHEMAHEGPT